MLETNPQPMVTAPKAVKMLQAVFTRLLLDLKARNSFQVNAEESFVAAFNTGRLADRPTAREVEKLNWPKEREQEARSTGRPNT